MEKGIDASVLLDRVKTGSIDPGLLKEAAEISATLSKYGLKDWCIYGQPGPDGTCSKFHVAPDQMTAFIGEIAGLKNGLLNFDVFPLGIINPEIYEVNLRVGNRR